MLRKKYNFNKIIIFINRFMCFLVVRLNGLCYSGRRLVNMAANVACCHFSTLSHNGILRLRPLGEPLWQTLVNH